MVGLRRPGFKFCMPFHHGRFVHTGSLQHFYSDLFVNGRPGPYASLVISLSKRIMVCFWILSRWHPYPMWPKALNQFLFWFELSTFFLVDKQSLGAILSALWKLNRTKYKES